MKSEINPENADKKRVLFVITQSELGGAQQFLVRLVKELDQATFLPMIVVGSDGSHEIKKMLPSGVSYLVVENLKRNPSVFRDIRAIFELRRIIREFRPDILFLNSSKAGFIGSLAGRLFITPRPRIIYRIGGWTFNDPWPAWKRFLYRWMEWLSAWLKDYIIVNNRHDLGQARSYGIKPGREVILIPNGIDPYMEFLSREEARLKLFDQVARSYVGQNKGGQGRLFHAKHIIGTVANFYPAKDLATLIEAMGHIDGQVACVIIGDGALRPQLEALVRSLRLENRVFLAGKIPAAHRYIPAFDVFILPSVKEGFPWAILESMAAKVPVIATRVGAVPEIIDSGKNGTVVDSHSPLQIAGAVQELLSNDRLRQDYAIVGHQAVLHHFNLRTMVEAYERLFSKP